MRTLVAGAVGLAAVVACAPASAQIFKCPSGGGYVFQQAPCPGLGASGGTLLVLANGAKAPRPMTPHAATGASDAVGEHRVLGRSALPTPTPVTNDQTR